MLAMVTKKPTMLTMRPKIVALFANLSTVCLVYSNDSHKNMATAITKIQEPIKDILYTGLSLVRSEKSMIQIN